MAVTEGSPEEIAYRLLLTIASNEEKTLRDSPGGSPANADRKWLLDTYKECLKVTKNPFYDD